jgi:WD repeat-containing protein 35
MFVFLSKKLGLPGGVRLRCVAWHAAGDWVACGGENGLLKVFRFAPGAADEEGENVGDAARRAPPRPLQHQTLEGHASAVALVDFCEPFGKLATADRSGLVIVWSLRSQAHQQQQPSMLWEEEAVHRAAAPT